MTPIKVDSIDRRRKIQTIFIKMRNGKILLERANEETKLVNSFTNKPSFNFQHDSIFEYKYNSQYSTNNKSIPNYLRDMETKK